MPTYDVRGQVQALIRLQRQWLMPRKVDPRDPQDRG